MACAHSAEVGRFTVVPFAATAENQSGLDMEKRFFHFGGLCGGTGVIHIARNVSGPGKNCQIRQKYFYMHHCAELLLCVYALEMHWDEYASPKQFSSTVS